MIFNHDTYSTYRFWIEIEGLAEGAFRECSGLRVETDIIEWEEGGLNSYQHRLLGANRFSNLTLKRGIATSDLWSWYYESIQGRVRRRSLSVILYGYTGAREIRWNINEAVPIKWIGPILSASSSDVAVEVIELAHHGFRRL